MKTQNNGMLKFFLMLSKALFVVVALCNLMLPITAKSWCHPHITQVVLVLVWFYGFLCSLGYFNNSITKEQDGIVVREISVPIIQIGIFRICQIIFFLLRGSELDWKMYFVCIGLDLFYLVLILVDKSNYYYISIAEGENETNKD